MVSVFVSSAADRGLEQHQGKRAKTGWFGIRIMCQSVRGDDQSGC